MEAVYIGTLMDDLYEYQGYDKIRYTARAIAENEEGKLGFLHIVGEDYFGERNHLESCGGGMEENEMLYDTLIREVREEMGFEVLDWEYIGTLVHTYNLLNTITYASFFHCHVNTAVHDIHRTEEEEILINEIVWLDPLEALDILEHKGDSRADKLVHRRDAMALRYYLENYMIKDMP